MMSIWVTSLERSLEQALDLLQSAVEACTDVWEQPMWPVPAPDEGSEFVGQDWNPITDPERNRELARLWVERRSTPWSVAWHALECLDYDLTGELHPWLPPPPFTEHPHWRDLATLERAWTRTQMIGYVADCRQRARDELGSLTDEKAATPLTDTHRYKGQPYARLLTGLPSHTVEHAAQIHQFVNDVG